MKRLIGLLVVSAIAGYAVYASGLFTAERDRGLLLPNVGNLPIDDFGKCGCTIKTCPIGETIEGYNEIRNLKCVWLDARQPDATCRYQHRFVYGTEDRPVGEPTEWQQYDERFRYEPTGWCRL